ncbi:S1C family serine protease, partial [Staphylococcus aureus]|nr:S1C family serine protease [Staphylococcus aureus]
DKNVKEDTDIRSYLYENKKPGDSVKLTVERKGKQQTVDVTLKEQKTTSQSSEGSSEEKSSPFN